MNFSIQLKEIHIVVPLPREYLIHFNHGQAV